MRDHWICVAACVLFFNTHGTASIATAGEIGTDTPAAGAESQA